MHRIEPLPIKTNRFTNVLFAITKKCTLKCEHCSEWEVLNQNETLSPEQILKVVNEAQALGSGQIQLMGGEPLLRMDIIQNILKSANNSSELWVLTSGVNLSQENASILKSGGLKGVMVSLDHYIKENHNAFRGSKTSFDWALKAIKNANDVGLVVGVSICVTKSFILNDNLFKYLEFVKKLNVSFVQILEPRSIGHYSNQEVELSEIEIKQIEQFYFNVNNNKKYLNYPIICYHGYHQRSLGCFGGGNRNLYIDTDGSLNACPFCKKKTGTALNNQFVNSIKELEASSCHKYQTASI